MEIRQLDNRVIHLSRYTLQSYPKDKPSPIFQHVLDLPLEYVNFDEFSSLKYRLNKRKLKTPREGNYSHKNMKPYIIVLRPIRCLQRSNLQENPFL